MYIRQKYKKLLFQYAVAAIATVAKSIVAPHNGKNNKVESTSTQNKHRAPASSQLFSRYFQPISGSQRERMSVKTKAASHSRVSLVLGPWLIAERALANWGLLGRLAGCVSACLTVVAAARPAVICVDFSISVWVRESKQNVGVTVVVSARKQQNVDDKFANFEN